MSGTQLMKCLCTLSIAGAAISAFPTLAVAEGSQAEAMKRLEPYVGTWTFEGKLRDGTPSKTERVYAWTMDRRFLKMEDTASAGGKTVTSTSYFGWQPEKGKLGFWLFSSDGSVAEGLEVAPTEPGALSFEGHMSSAQSADFRGSAVIQDADHLVNVIEVKVGEKWVSLGRQVLTKKK